MCLPQQSAACYCAEALLDVVTGRLQAAERTLKEDEEAVRGWTLAVQLWHGSVIQCTLHVSEFQKLFALLPKSFKGNPV